MILSPTWWFLSVGAACLMTWIIVGFLSHMAPGLGLVDLPNERSSHTQVKPRGGGIGFVTTWSLGCLGCWYWKREHLLSGELLMVFLLCAIVISAVSLWDDYRSVGAGLRFAFHLICSAVIVGVFGWFEKVDIGWVVQLGSLGVFATTIWIVGLTNVYNFMDGIDGLAGLQGVVAGLAWCLAGIHLNAPSACIAGAFVASGSAGFLIHNWSPAKIFMGDVGSAFLGFVFGGLPLIALRELPDNTGSTEGARLPIFALLVIWPFFADGSFTFCRRLSKCEAVWKPHRSHLYQRLVQVGWSHAAVASYYGIWAVLCSVVGLHYLQSGKVYLVILVTALFFILTWSLTLYCENRKGPGNSAPPPMPNRS